MYVHSIYLYNSTTYNNIYVGKYVLHCVQQSARQQSYTTSGKQNIPDSFAIRTEML